MCHTEATESRFVELLSPAGDWQCAQAAIENGADAIYFGLDCGFNARHRAQNFGIADLPELAANLRRRGVRGYATLNTLVFPSELCSLVEVIEGIAVSGIDAVLVQDFGAARLVRELCPELEIHASTQMSLSSAETIRVARELGLARVVVARELSVQDIRKIRQATEMPLEVFIHGALCVAYSGQCLTSESLGGRSANRGQCAQACRLPYELVCDGEDRDLQQMRYLLSPQDLAGYDSIPALVDAGVHSLKIEGRLKTPEYVANITAHYRRAIDEAVEQGTVTVKETSKQEMELSFSRGFSPGWLAGNDHKRLVPGLESSKRGIELGAVREVSQRQLRIRLAAPVSLGDGIAIHGGGNRPAQGGRIYSLANGQGELASSLGAGSDASLGFGRGELDWESIQPGDRVFKNDDPKLNRRLRATYSGPDPTRRQPIDMEVIAQSGMPLRLSGRLASGVFASVTSADPLAPAQKHPITEEILRDKLGRLGGTPFELRNLTMRTASSPMVPMGLLNQLRRELIGELLEQLGRPPDRRIDRPAADALLAPIESCPGGEAGPNETFSPRLAVLCRTMDQLQSACRFGVDLAYVDFHDIRDYGPAVVLARESNTPIGIATVRMHKPGEGGLLKVLLRHQPDVILARNLAALACFQGESVSVVADFSLNVANHRSAEWIRSLGATRVTASYDLNRQQLLELVDSMPSDWLETVIHQHMPMFHMEHCVFCAAISPGTNKTNCGRPCDRHVVQLRDRVGAEHTLQADVACRNTLYNATPQSSAEVVAELTRRRVGWYRLELLEETGDQAMSIIGTYRQLLDGDIDGQAVWKRLKASNRVGVTRGTLESKRNPLAIL